MWVLLGPHKGDNNQVLALAEALGLPFRTITLKYERFAHVPALCRSISISQLTDECRLEIAPPWPSLVLGIGQRSAPVARYIQQASGGRAKTIRLGDPMVSPRLFDLVITTTQYAVREADNVIRLPITITNEDTVHPSRLEAQWLEEFEKPRRLLVIGGKTSLWRFDEQVVADALTTLERRARREGGSVLAVASPRTSRELVATAEALLPQQAVVTGNFPRYGALLNGADEIHVTGDSVSMLSDAVTSGKPVGLIPLEPTRLANLLKWAGKVRGRPLRLRDLEKFWDDLRARGLVGTIDEPRSGVLDVSPMEIAVAAVHATLEGRIPEALAPALGTVTGSAAAEPMAL